MGEGKRDRERGKEGGKEREHTWSHVHRLPSVSFSKESSIAAQNAAFRRGLRVP